MKNLKYLKLCCICCLLLSGCSGVSQLEKEAEKVGKSNGNSQKQEGSEEQQLEEWKDFYKDYEKPVEEALEKDPAINVETNRKKVTIKEHYYNENEFSIFVSDVLISLRKGQLKADKYLSFLKQYASDYYKSKYELGKNKTKDINFVQNIISLMKEDQKDIQAYKTSNVMYHNGADYEGYFFIECTYNTGQKVYFRIDIEKDDDGWKMKDERIAYGVVFTENGKVLE